MPKEFTELPLSEASVQHIRSNNMPSLFATWQIKRVLSECHRVLAPGGILELRIVEPCPEVTGSAFKLQEWLDLHLVFNLEKAMRCVRPGRLIPVWLRECGFELTRDADQVVHRLPCIARPTEYVEEKIAYEVGRRLWDECWGDYIETGAGEVRYWWEAEGVVDEVKDMDAAVSLITIIAKKT